MTTLFMQTTTVDAARTAAEIHECLRAYGADAIMTEYEKNELRAIQFRITTGPAINGVAPGIVYKLPCRWEAVLKILTENNRKKRHQFQRNKLAQQVKLIEKAKRIAWRQIFRWTEAQLALIATGMADIKEVFLPFAITAEGGTVYELVQQKGLPQLGYAPEKEGA